MGQSTKTFILIIALAAIAALFSMSGSLFAQTSSAPSCTMNIDPGRINPGQQTTLSWSSKNADSVVLNQGIGAKPVNHLMFVTASKDTTYQATFTGPAGSVTCTATLEVTKTIGSLRCSLTATPQQILPGQSSQISWRSENTSSAAFDQGIGPVPVSGSRTVNPQVTTTYNVNFSGPDGTLTCATSVEVLDQDSLPTCTLSASPTTVRPGTTTTLQWESSQATRAFINNGIGSVPTTGSRVVSPGETRTYTATFSGNTGSKNCSATVFVSDFASSNERLSITTRVSNLTQGTTGFNSSVNAQTGDKLKFEIRATTKGVRAQEQVTVTNSLPAGLSLIQGTTRVDNQFDVAGDSLFGSGRNLGLVSPGQTRVFTFETSVQSSGSNRLSNTASVKSKSAGSVQDSAIVVLQTTQPGNSGNLLQFPIAPPANPGLVDNSPGFVQGSTTTLPPRTGADAWAAVLLAGLFTLVYKAKRSWSKA